MTIKIPSFLLFFLVFTVACSSKKKLASVSVPEQDSEIVDLKTTVNNNAVVYIEPKQNVAIKAEMVDDSTFVNLKDYSSDFVYNMKYATKDNFLKSKVYDCEACYLRYKTVKALLKANEKFMQKGYKIMLFDCYRPLDIQKKMWEIVSNPNYVADPKKGSIHNRGGAVDISLVDSNGKEVDMGTPFDFFGIEAAQDYDNLTDEIKENRKLLRKIMTRSNFKIFESEWWHYNLKNAKKENLSNFKWKCD